MSSSVCPRPPACRCWESSRERDGRRGSSRRARCGIKPGGVPYLAIGATEDHAAVAAAGVFTSNLAQAAPVQVSKRHLANGRAAAVVLSSGNANAATGEPGRRDATRMCELAGRGLALATDDVLVVDGLIGIAHGRTRGRHPKLANSSRPPGAAAAGDDDHRHEAEGSAGPWVRGDFGGWPGAAMLSRRWPTLAAPPTPRSSPKRCARSPTPSDHVDCLSRRLPL